MEFRLNKVDLDVRERIKEQTKEGKVHSKQNITIQKDQHNKGGKRQDFYEQLKKQSEDKNKKIKVNAIKYCKKENVDVEATKEEVEGKDSVVGSILDTKK